MYVFTYTTDQSIQIYHLFILLSPCLNCLSEILFVSYNRAKKKRRIWQNDNELPVNLF